MLTRHYFCLSLIFLFVSGISNLANASCISQNYSQITSACTKVHSRVMGATTWVKSDGSYRYTPLPQGDSFQGTWQFGMPDGFGEYTFDDGDRYVGDIKAGIFQGRGKLITYTGNVFIGEFTGGELTGKVTIKYADGANYSGDFVRGQPNGTGVLISGAGTIYKGSFLNGKKHGSGYIEYSTGGSYKGNFKNGVFSGTGVLTNNFGDVFESDEWKNGSVNGGVYIKYASGAFFKGTMLSGKKNGHGKYVWPGHGYDEGNYSDDLLNGIGKRVRFDETNNTEVAFVYEGNFINGLKDGLGHEVSTANLYTYKRLRTGLMRRTTTLIPESDDSKKLEFSGTWSNDQFQSGVIKYENGDELDVKIDNGRLDGKFTAKSKGFFDGSWDNKGAFTGTSYAMNDQGDIYIGPIVDGEKHGIGVYQPILKDLYHPANELYIGEFKNGLKRGVGYFIDLKSKRVRSCEFLPLKAPRCKKSHFLDSTLPVRDYFGFSDYLVPVLKKKIAVLDWEQRIKIGIQEWSFNTFIHLLYENAMRFQSVDLSSNHLVDRLLISMEESPFALGSDDLFLNILRAEY